MKVSLGIRAAVREGKELHDQWIGGGDSIDPCPRAIKFRVRKEIRQVQEEYDKQLAAQKESGSYPTHIPDGLTLFFSPVVPVDGDELHVKWTIQVHKSKVPDSNWSNCQFTFDAMFKEGQYPACAPKVTCKTPILHPNICPSGLVDHVMLSGGWRPNITLLDIVTGIFWLFLDPNFNDPLPECQEASVLGLTEKAEFRRRSLAHAQQHKTFIPGTEEH